MFEYPKQVKNSATTPIRRAPISTDPEDLTARELYDQCRTIGSLALKSRRQFIGLLPLVERRQAYRGRGLYSTYDFAAMLGGISRDIVTEVLRLDAQLREFPLVRKLLYEGRIGWSKIRMVTSWLTVENQEEWIGKLENLSNQALTVYLRDFTIQQYRESQRSIIDVTETAGELTMKNSISLSSSFKETDENKAGNFGAEIIEYNREVMNSQISGISATQNSAPGEIFTTDSTSTAGYPLPTKFDSLAYERETFSFSLNRQIAARMRLFRQKLEKERKELITWEEVMVEFLKKMENADAKPIAKVSTMAQPTTQRPIISTDQEGTDQEGDDSAMASRHIPMAVRREVLRQYNGLCAFRDCNKPAEIFHHTRRFSLTNNLPAAQAHDPNFIKPLCKPHERVIHNSLIANEEIDPADWKLLANPDTNAKKYIVDQMVIGYRKPK